MVDNVYDPLLGEPSQRDEREASAESCRGFKTSTSEPDGARARQKLVAALAICAVAVAAEVVGGVLAHSLALLTDAAHLLSDLSGYLIGLFALWAVSLQASQKSSFGYHRVEILGALLSILVIWAVTGVLVLEAISRIYNPQPVDGPVMFGVAVFGLGVNLLLLSVLGAHGHSHGGGGAGHGHAHGDADSSPMSISTSRHHDAHGGGEEEQSHEPEHEHAPSLARLHAHSHSHGGGAAETTTHAHGHGHAEEASHAEAEDVCGQAAAPSPVGMALLARRGTTPAAPTSVSSSSFASFVGVGGGGERAEIDNINVRAAALHVVGDLVQSVGVIVASVVVWVKPEWSVADPICTLLFAVLVLFTTWGMLREIVDVLMEHTPKGVNIREVKEALWAIEGVEGVHCLHVWALTTGKFLASAHVRVAEGTHDNVLAHVERVLATHLGDACHTTIQVTARDQCCTSNGTVLPTDIVGV